MAAPRPPSMVDIISRDPGSRCFVQEFGRDSRRSVTWKITFSGSVVYICIIYSRQQTCSLLMCRATAVVVVGQDGRVTGPWIVHTWWLRAGTKSWVSRRRFCCVDRKLNDVPGPPRQAEESKSKTRSQTVGVCATSCSILNDFVKQVRDDYDFACSQSLNMLFLFFLIFLPFSSF